MNEIQIEVKEIIKNCVNLRKFYSEHKKLHCRGVCKNCYRLIHYAEHERERRGAKKHNLHSVGTRSIDKDGYARIKVGFGHGAKDWKDEHTLVMEKLLGRKLFPNEEVHHKNGIRSDNNEENLELWVTSQPKGQRVIDLVHHAKHILNTYGEQLCPIDAEYF